MVFLLRRKLNVSTMLVVILSICLFFGIISNLSNSNAPIILVIVMIGALFSPYFNAVINKLSVSDLKMGLLIGVVLMIIGQVFILEKMKVTVQYDPFRVIAQADRLVKNNEAWNVPYFWRYPNNVPLAYGLSLLFKMGLAVGISENIVVNLLSLSLLDILIVLLILTVYQLSSTPNLAVKAWIFLTLTPFAYTYYLQVFYSDLPDMLILLIIFRILWFWKNRSKIQKIVGGVELVVITALGQIIKPNLIVILIAIVLISIIRWRLIFRIHLTRPLLLILVGFALSIPGTKMIYSATGFVQNDAYALPASNWILMGSNSNSNGQYSGRDVKNAASLSTKRQRQSYDIKLIIKRYQKMGIIGAVKLWFSKLLILLNVQNIGNWYSGGFRVTLSWYQKNNVLFQRVAMISYQTATIYLFGGVILRLIKWRFQAQRRSVLIELLVITGLGYLAFHTLVWEVESRYGQVEIPILWLLMAALPEFSLAKSDRRWLLTSILGATILTTLTPHAQIPTSNGIVAQRGQSTEEIGSGPKLLSPRGTITQQINLANSISFFQVQNQFAGRLEATVINVKTGKKLRMNQAKGDFYINQILSKGKYEVKIENSSLDIQPVDIVETNNYLLAEYPMYFNGKIEKYSSLIFRGIR